MTQGMVEDLLEPQEAFNKIGSTNAEIVARSSAGGWQVEEGSLSQEEETRLLTEGAAPDTYNFIKPIMSSLNRLYRTCHPKRMNGYRFSIAMKLKKISGINESALVNLIEFNLALL